MNRILVGDVVSGLAQLPEGCVQTCVTSPPYYGLRDYGVTGQIGLEPTPEEFMGSGTTAVVAQRLGRNYVGCELNPAYAAMAERRIASTQPGLQLA